MLVQISTGNIIGGETSEVRNVISGHDGPGIQVTDSAGLNAIGSNYIGTNSTGDDDVPNNSGIVVDNASELVIVGNVVSGNDGSGIVAQNSGATSNEIRQNLIGVAANGFSPLGNGEAGMSFYGTGPNLIGGDSPDDGNTIAHNGAAGIEVVPELPFSTGKAIQFNSIFANDGLGIDLAPDKSFEGDGVTPNDDQDGDFGGNALQNFPVLVSAAEAGGDVTVSGSLESQANSDYTLHFYANIECDPSGFGEGEFPSPTTIEVATDGNGHAEFQAEVDSEAGVGGFITATAQDEEGSTSEFSECVEITGATPTATPTATETPGPTPTPGTTATPGPTPTGTPGKGGLLGDTDCDEDIDSVDSLGVLREVAGLSFIVKCIAEGDVQCDGDRDSVDALGIQRHVAALPQISQEKGCRDIGT
jgi:parallel beta-helix repeat protein